MDVVFTWLSAFADRGPVLFGLLFGLAFANVFIPPVPVETLSLFGGYLTGIGHGNPVLMWMALSNGIFCGSTLLYYLARSQEQRLFKVSIIGRQVTPERLAKAANWFKRFGVWTIYAGKLVPGMSFITVLASGLFGVQPNKALTAIYLSNLLYFAATVSLGRALGERWHDAAALAKQFWPWLLIGLLLAAVGVFIHSRWVKKRR